MINFKVTVYAMRRNQNNSKLVTREEISIIVINFLRKVSKVNISKYIVCGLWRQVVKSWNTEKNGRGPLENKA